MPVKLIVMKRYETLDLIEEVLIFIEFSVGLICYMKLDKAYRIFFLYTCVSLFHVIIFFLMWNPVSINIEWYSITLLGASFYLLFLLNALKIQKIKRNFLLFIASLSILIITEIILIGINTYRTSMVDTISNFFLLVLTFRVLIENLKTNHDFKNKSIFFILVSQIQFIIVNIIYNIVLFFTYHYHLNNNNIKISIILQISSIITSLCISIAYICSPRKEIFLKHS